MSLTISQKETLLSIHAFELQNWVNNNLPTLNAVEAVSQLLNELPEIEVKKESTFLVACKKRLRQKQAEKFFKAEKNEIAMFLADNLFIEDWQAESNAALQHLVEHFHL